MNNGEQFDRDLDAWIEEAEAVWADFASMQELSPADWLQLAVRMESTAEVGDRLVGPLRRIATQPDWYPAIFHEAAADSLAQVTAGGERLRSLALIIRHHLFGDDEEFKRAVAEEWRFDLDNAVARWTDHDVR